MKTLYKPLLFSLALSMLCACSKEEQHPPIIYGEFGKEFTLYYGQQINLVDSSPEKNDTLTIKIEKMEDSRCPSNVTCFIHGSATVNLQIQNGNAVKNGIQLCIGDCNPPTSSDPTYPFDSVRFSMGIQDYIAILKSIKPYPKYDSKQRLDTKKIAVMTVLID